MYILSASKLISPEATDTGRIRSRCKAMLKLLYSSSRFSLYLSMSNGQVATWSGKVWREELISRAKSSASMSCGVYSNFWHHSWSFPFFIVCFMLSSWEEKVINVIKTFQFWKSVTQASEGCVNQGQEEVSSESLIWTGISSVIHIETVFSF